jgi:hypothetical protein
VPAIQRVGYAAGRLRGAPGRGAGPPAVNLRAMHGMLSAAILIGVFALTAAVCLYLAVRAFAAGRAQPQAHGQAHGQAGRHGDASLP